MHFIEPTPLKSIWADALGIANIFIQMQLHNIIYKVIVFILRCYVIRDKVKKRKNCLKYSSEEIGY